MESSIHTEKDPAIRSAVRQELADFGHLPGNVGEQAVRQTVTVTDISDYKPKPEPAVCDMRWQVIGIDYS